MAWYRDLLTAACVSEKRIPVVMRASSAEIDALKLDEAGKIVDADKIIEKVKSDWSDFVVFTETRGVDTPNPPVLYTSNNDEAIAAAFKPKI